MFFNFRKNTNHVKNTVPPERPVKLILQNGFSADFNNNTIYLYQNSKEVFDGEIKAERNGFLIAEGYSGDREAIAHIGENGLVSIKKTDCGVEAARLTDAGIGIVITDEDKILVVSNEGVKTISFLFWSVDDAAKVLTDTFCASIEEDYASKDNACVLRFFKFETQSTWKKKIKYQAGDADPLLVTDGKDLIATTPDGCAFRYDLSGTLVH